MATSRYGHINAVTCRRRGAGNPLRFNLQASTDGDVAELEGFPNPAAGDITMKSLQIGSLQPIRQGVVAW
jgi:hypothetical protein